MSSAADTKTDVANLGDRLRYQLAARLFALVFLPAGRIDWTPGWIFVAVLVAVFGLSALLLARVNPMISALAAGSRQAVRNGT
jgi:hypothetical protein